MIGFPTGAGSGKRGVRLSTGKASMFNPSSMCLECCGAPESGVDCVNCAGGTPLQLELVVSGVSFCCSIHIHLPPFPGATIVSDPYGELNTTHVLTQLGHNPCIWTTEITLHMAIYSDNNCETLDSEEDVIGYIDAHRDAADTWSVAMFVEQRDASRVFFVDTSGVEDGCSPSGLVLTNTRTCGNLSLGGSGTATLSLL